MKLALFNTREMEFIGEFPMDQTGTTQSTNWECSRTNDCPQASDDGQKFDAFLSHSGEQKEFVRQLHEDLTNQGVSSFFDQNRDFLPLADRFAARIFRAIETCNVSVLLLSKKFLHSKWPMLELAASVNRYETRRDPKLTILPVFFKIEIDALKKITPENEEWTKIVEIPEKMRAEWHRAVRVILRIIGGMNGLNFKEGDNEVKFRAEIVDAIRKILPTPSPRYPVRGMQGEARMCQEVANFIVDKVEPQKNKIHIAGLCGIAGQGKTILGKAFCNVKLDEFNGKVCHLEFSGGDPIERTKLALQYLTPRARQSFLQTLISQDQAQAEFYKRVKGQRVLLVLDNITDESIDEVRDYLRADLGENSLILLSARSVDLLVKYFNIDSQSCMQVPKLEKQEAIAILLERAFLREPTLTREGEDFALKCAERCSFKETCCDSTHPRTRKFHPLALQALGGYLFSKHSLNLSKWVAEIDDMVDRGREGLDKVFALLDKAFNDMPDQYRTIFMLLTVYRLPNMSPVEVFEWIAIICNQEISSIEKAVQDLRTKAFIEEFEPQILIQDLYIEFAQSRANKMEKWLWRKEDDQSSNRQLIAKDNEGFELAKLEQCMHQTISPRYIRYLLVLQLVDVKKMNKLDLGRMESLRSLTLRDCKLLAALDGTEKLTDLAWLQISGVNRKFRLPELSSFSGLKHLEINIPASQVVDQLGDLTNCSRLRKIYVVCPSLLKFPSLKGMEHLEKLEFILCDNAQGLLDCTGCVKLQTIVLNGCENLSKLILLNCDQLKILQLWNMRELVELPSFRPLSNLCVLELVKCSIREPPDLTCCPKLEKVFFFQLKNLVSFPIFSSLTELKKLSLCNCTSVQDPPDIEGCHKLQVFHLLYNDSMKGFSNFDEWAELEEIQVSWHSAGEVQYQGFRPSSCQANDDLEICLKHFKDERFGNISDESMPEALKKLEWLKGKQKLVKRYFRGLRLYYSLRAPFADGDVPLKDCRKKRIILGTMDGKVTTLSRKLDKDSQDDCWLKKVEEYFGAIAPAIFTSDIVEDRSSDIVEDSSSLLPLSPIQGEERMCQELADFFNTLNPNGKGIRMAGLYGMPGLGKTTLAKAFCRRNLRNFDGRVCYLDFSGDSASERLKLVLEDLTESMMPNEDDAQNLCKALVNDKKVLLVLDDISDQNIEEVNDYLGRIDFGKDSWILLSTRRLHVLENDFKIDSRCCMHVPSLQKKEAIAILLERILKLSGDSDLTVESEEFASKFAEKCLFKDDRGLDQFHPLALKALGRHILSQWAGRSEMALGQHLRELWSHWAGDGSNDVFGLLDRVFDAMEYKCRITFLLLATRMGPKMSTEETYKWLQENYNGGFENIQTAVSDLRDNAFIEEIEYKIHIHDLFREFAYSKHKDNVSTDFQQVDSSPSMEIVPQVSQASSNSIKIHPDIKDLILHREAYCPKTVALGVCNDGGSFCVSETSKENVNMVDEKMKALCTTANRLKEGKTVEYLVEEIEKLGREIVDWYNYNGNLTGDILAWNFAMDACFILEFFRASYRFKNLSLEREIMIDIFKMENQIPLFILRKILELEFGTPQKAISQLASLMCMRPRFAVLPFSLKFMECKDLQTEIEENIKKDPCHLLQLLSKTIEASLQLSNVPIREPGVEFVSDLADVILAVAHRDVDIGDNFLIRFKPSRDGQIQFKKGWFGSCALYLPQIYLCEETEPLFWNLIALASTSENNIIGNFMFFMNWIISFHKKSIVVLKKKKLIISGKGNAELSEMFSKLSLMVCKSIGPFGKIQKQIEEHHNSSFSKWMLRSIQSICLMFQFPFIGQILLFAFVVSIFFTR